MVVTFFMKLHASAALNACIALRSKLHKCQEQGIVVSYREVVTYLVAKYAIDEVIAESVADRSPFTRLSSKPPTY